jgi:glycogen debranching enzyme
VAELARHLGHASLADRLERRASDLRSRIAASYWMEDRSTFALALDAHKRKLDSLTSNPGHLLFCAAVAPDRAKRVAATLLCDEMFSGFGIRTMGSREAAFNPMSYHNGSVWPHDNALALWGFVRYGLVDEAAKLAGAFLDALARFPDEAPPELFCGFSRDEAPSPVPYLQANKPQAWASGAVLLLVRSILGLSIDALSKRVSVRLVPIPGLRRLSFTGVPCGEGRIDVHVDGGRVRVEGVPGNFQLDVPRS